jgi:hypothetical protein
MAATQKVTNGSKSWLETLIEENQLTEKTKGRLGTGSTAAAAADTTLDAEIAGSEKSFESVSQTDDDTTYEYRLTFTELNSVGDTIKEIGIFNADGTLHNRVVFDAGDYITKDNTKEFYFRLTETKTVTINT